MRYLFFLGSHPAISVAEIISYLELKQKAFSLPTLVYPGVLLVESDNLPVETVQRQLGGTVKIAELLKHQPANMGEARDIIIEELSALPVKRLYFGFSAYGLRLERGFGLDIKKKLVKSGAMARLVVSREPILSSVVVAQNKLLTDGYEFSLIKSSQGLLLAKTLSVQFFKDLSARDYGRPGRDDHSGMLPPKLAQMMINLAQADLHEPLLDPFCGSGTVLTEAALLGYRELCGSDISAKAVADSQDNFSWQKEKGGLTLVNCQIVQASVLDLLKFYQPDSLGAIVTEPFLGPQRGSYDVRQAVGELEALYRQAIGVFYRLLKPGGRVVMVWPVFRSGKDRIYLSAKIAGSFKIARPFSESFDKHLLLTNRQTMLYGRADQRVWRELVILEK